MTSDPKSPINAGDLMQERALAAAVQAKAAASSAGKMPSPPPQHRALPGGTALLGEGVSDTAELMRLVGLLKQVEADSNVAERTVVIGEFSVAASRIPATFIAQLQTLSRAEAAVIRMLGWGRSNADIAMLLNANENTIRTHMNNAVRKLELDGMRECITLAGLLFHPLD